MTLVGMDTDVVRQISTGLGAQADQLDIIATTVDSLVREAMTTWRGRDAVAFAEEWSGTHLPALALVRQLVEDMAAVALTNAEEQDVASGEGATGGGSGAGVTPPSVVDVVRDLLRTGWQTGVSIGPVLTTGEVERTGTLGPGTWKAEGSYDLGATASANLKIDGKGIDADAGVRAGLSATTGAEAHLGIASAAVKVDGFAGARAQAEGHVGPTGAKWAVEALAGAKVKGEVGGTVAGLGGKATAEAWAGLGFIADGSYGFHEGKIELGGKLGGAFVVGGSLGAEVSIDVSEFSDAVDAAADRVGTFFAR